MKTYQCLRESLLIPLPHLLPITPTLLDYPQLVRPITCFGGGDMLRDTHRSGKVKVTALKEFSSSLTNTSTSMSYETGHLYMVDLG